MASFFPASFENLIDSFASLPGIGRRSALRLALHLLSEPVPNVEKFSSSIVDFRSKIKFCPRCHMLSDDGSCAFCDDASRVSRTVCVVENHADVLSREEWLQDVRALALFISAVFKTGVPGELLRLLPHHPSPDTQHPSPNTRYMRCVVSRFDAETIWADTADGGHVEVNYSEHEYLRKILREGMQLNLLDSHAEEERVQPGIVVVEPDFLLDISTLAHCFQGSYGHHPLFYTAERLRPRGNSQAMLLGNFAGAALDDIIWSGEDYRLSDTMNGFFREQALQFKFELGRRQLQISFVGTDDSSCCQRMESSVGSRPSKDEVGV